VEFSGGIPTWLAAIVLVAVVAVTGASYALTRRQVGRGHAILLGAIRVLAAALLALLVLRPLVTFRTTEGVRGRYFLLVDTSRSMSIFDYPNLPARIERVKHVFSQPSSQVLTFLQNAQVEAHGFDAALSEEAALADIALLLAEGEETRLFEALNSVAEKAAGVGASGIMVFTDGIDTGEGRDYTGSIPVTAVGVGSRLAAEGDFRDLILSNVEVLPEGEPVVSKGNVARIAAYVEGLGYPGLLATVSLTDSSGARIAAERLAVDGVRGDQEVVLSFTPEERGNFKYSVEVTGEPGENILENNFRSLNITVTDPQISVLYAEGTLRYEYRYLRRVLQKDPNLGFVALVRLDRNTFYQQGQVEGIELSGFPADVETLKKFDVLILGDLDASAFSERDFANIREMVYEGAGFLMTGGYNSLGTSYDGTVAAEILPVATSDGTQDRNEFLPQLTDRGESSPIFAGITEYFGAPGRGASKKIPRLLGQVRLGRPKPAATVLAVNPLRRDEAGPLPVLVVGNFGAGRTAALAVDTTWRWYAPAKGLGLESPYVRFWGQLVRWLAGYEGEEEVGQPGLEAWLDKAFYALGDPVYISAKVRGGDGLLTDKARVQAHLEGPEEMTLSLGRAAGATNVYVGEVKPSKSGTYTLRLKAEVGGETAGETGVSFEVGKEDLEMRRVDLDEAALKRIASESGGEYMPLVDFPSYAGTLASARTTEKRVEFLSLRHRKALYVLFAVFVALVTAEWFWRRRLQLP
jgi:uncharacterized membrane protein